MTLVEQCTVLDITLLRDSLRRVRKGESGVSGILSLANGTQARYWFETENREDFVYTAHGQNEPQKISLTECELKFGTRSFFVCECGYRASKLFLKPPPGNSEFKCRKCHRLRYELEMINRHSLQGTHFYRMNRRIKAINSRESMGSRIFYGGQYTSRFMRYLSLCGQAGLNNEIAEAHRMLTAIHAQ